MHFVLKKKSSFAILLTKNHVAVNSSVCDPQVSNFSELVWKLAPE